MNTMTEMANAVGKLTKDLFENEERKGRTPLLMANGEEVVTLEALRENFDIESVYDYWRTGELVEWLNARYYTDIVDEIEELDEYADDVKLCLYEIFDVESPEKVAIEKAKAEVREEKLRKLQEYTTDHKYVRVIDKIAFTQEDLYCFLDTGEKEIYLCGEKFEVPLSVENVKYIGVNEPLVMLRIKKKIMLGADKGIVFENVRFGMSKLEDESKKFLLGIDDYFWDKEAETEIVGILDAKLCPDIDHFMNDFRYYGNAYIEMIYEYDSENEAGDYKKYSDYFSILQKELFKKN